LFTVKVLFFTPEQSISRGGLENAEGDVAVGGKRVVGAPGKKDEECRGVGFHESDAIWVFKIL